MPHDRRPHFIANNSTLQTGGGSFELTGWFKLNKVTGFQGLFTKLQGGSTWEFQSYVASGQITYLTRSAGGVNTELDFLTPLYTNAWYFIDLYYNATNGSMGLGVNGSFNTNTGVSPTASTTGALLIGADGPPSDYMNGSVDEVGIWIGRVLTSAERATLYDYGLANHYPWSWATFRHYGNIATNSTYSVIISNGNYNAFPGLAILPNNHLFCTWYKGSGHVDTNAVQVYSVSTNQGLTWPAPTTIPNTTSTRGGEVLMLPTGNMLAIWPFLTNINNRAIHTFCGTISGDTVTFTDIGQIGVGTAPLTTWTKYNQSASRPLLLRDGATLLLPVYGMANGDTFESMGVVTSTNWGTNWSNFVSVAPGTGTQEYNEAQAIQRPDGTIYVLIRFDAPGTKYVYSLSTDNGATWTSNLILPFWATTIGVAGYPTVFPMTSGGVLLMARSFSGQEEGWATSWDYGTSFTPFTQISLTGKACEYQSAIEWPSRTVSAVYSQEITSQVVAQLIYQEFVDPSP